jgi:hypothetical protein
MNISIQILEEPENEFERDYNLMIQLRNDYETELYDFLLSPGILFIPEEPEDFWEPVTIKFEKVHELEDIIGENECSICLENHLNFKKTSCCRQKMCNGCCFTWFETSVKCPYCYQDIREFDLKKPGF